MLLAAADIHGEGTEGAEVSYGLGVVDRHGALGAEARVCQNQQHGRL